MKFLRLLVIGLVMALGVAVVAVIVAFHNQTRLVRLVLAQITQRTGYDIAISGTRLGFRSHLIVVLERPRVFLNGREIARFASARAALSYHALIHRNGLPLYALVLIRANVKIPARATPVATAGLPRFDHQMIDALQRNLDAANDIAQRLEIIDATVSRDDNLPLVDHLNVIAYRRHRMGGKWPWLLSFDTRWRRPPIDGIRFAGDIRLGARPYKADAISAARIWFWGLDLNGLKIADLESWGQAQGSLRFSLDQSGTLTGTSDINIRKLVIGGSPFNAKMDLGDYSSLATWDVSTERADVTRLTLSQGKSQILAGRLHVLQPYEQTRVVTLSAGGMKFALAKSGSWLRSIRNVPLAVIQFADRFRAGYLTLEDVFLETREAPEIWTPANLRQKLRVTATLTNVGYLLPPDLKLQPLEHLDAQLEYSGGAIQVSQGSADIGDTHVSSFSINSDLRRAPAEIPYRLKVKADADAGEIYTATKGALDGAVPQLRGRVEWVHGHAPMTANASGTIKGHKFSLPRDYEAQATLARVEILPNNAPSAIAFEQGRITLRPGEIELADVLASPTINPSSTVALSGTMTTSPQFPSLKNVSAELHQIQAEQWLPLLIEPDQLSVRGAIDGKLAANSSAASGHPPTVTGTLALGSGVMQFGFLRAPMVVQSATLTLDGRGLVLAIPASRFENEALDFRLAVADLAHPIMRIDAKASRLDFEAMRFIRLPWSPKQPPHFFAVPAVGHIEAPHASFEKLALSNVSTDFSRDQTDWRVYNFFADSFGGRIDLELSGRARDEWIRIKGRIVDLNAGPLFMMSGQQGKPPLTGRLYANADLWANTDVNFFDTLAGGVSVQINDGIVDRFTLLSRILSLIDLKNWLTARFPDPRRHGIPFNVLTGDFKGRDGDFYTENLVLQGPVMDISARGDVRLGAGSMNMEIGLVPFNTANWIVSKIPIVGENLSGGSSGLVAAYFRVRGPVRNPTVIPMPITSVKEFVIKMLGLPINIIAPNTIK